MILDSSMNRIMEHIQTSRENRKLLYEGYVYGLDKNLSPLTVMMGFGMATVQSLEHNFPEAEIQGYFGQCLEESSCC